VGVRTAGWNYLLEGRKQWTFVPPSREVDALLRPYRLAPVAWGDGDGGDFNVSAGWQSDLDLYKRGVRAGAGGRAQEVGDGGH
jgi:hypothetical protein